MTCKGQSMHKVEGTLEVTCILFFYWRIINKLRIRQQSYILGQRQSKAERCAIFVLYNLDSYSSNPFTSCSVIHCINFLSIQLTLYRVPWLRGVFEPVVSGLVLSCRVSALGKPRKLTTFYGFPSHFSIAIDVLLLIVIRVKHHGSISAYSAQSHVQPLPAPTAAPSESDTILTPHHSIQCQILVTNRLRLDNSIREPKEYKAWFCDILWRQWES